MDCNSEFVPIYMRHSLFNTTKCITLLFIVQSLLHNTALWLTIINAALLCKRPGSVWNCVWGHALQSYYGINLKSRVFYPSPGFVLCCIAFDADKLPLLIYQSIIEIKLGKPYKDECMSQISSKSKMYLTKNVH